MPLSSTSSQRKSRDGVVCRSTSSELRFAGSEQRRASRNHHGPRSYPSIRAAGEVCTSKKVGVTFDPDHTSWQYEDLAQLQARAEELKPKLLCSWDDIVREQKQARDAAANAWGQKHGSTVTRRRRRAGQIKRGRKDVT